MMKLFYSWFVLALLQRFALGAPKPDFGIEATVSGSAKVHSLASDAGTGFDLIDDKTISLHTHYLRLHNLEAELTLVGAQIATTGQELTDKLATFTLSISNLPEVFTDAIDAIDTLRTLLMSGLSQPKFAIETMVGLYIVDMFVDALEQLYDTLARLKTALELVHTGVNNAVVAYGSATIPDTFIRRYVSPKVIFDLQRAMYDLHSDLPLVAYIMELTLRHLQAADIYLMSVLQHATATVSEVIMHYDGFKMEIMEASIHTSDAVATPFRLAYTAQTASLAFIMTDLEAMDSYPSAIEPVFAAYETAFDSTNRDILAGDIEVLFSSYLTQVVTLDDYIDRFYDEKLCVPVQDVLQVLIASGPWADYCFNKYSKRLFDMVSVNANHFQMCYEIEADRLQRLYELVDRITVQIIFDVEDLATHVFECFYRIERASECFALIGPSYIDLSTLVILKQVDLINLINFEMSASFNRMAACVAGGKCGLLSSADHVVLGIQACEQDGPNAD